METKQVQVKCSMRNYVGAKIAEDYLDNPTESDFYRDEDGYIIVPVEQIKGSIFAGSQFLGSHLLKTGGQAGMKKKIALEYYDVFPTNGSEYIYSAKDGKKLKEKDKLWERMVSNIDAKGVKSWRLAKNPVVKSADFEFMFEYEVGSPLDNMKLIEELLTMAGKVGIGTSRKLGYGKYSVEIVE